MSKTHIYGESRERVRWGGKKRSLLIKNTNPRGREEERERE
jgi:hypothetical protein